MAKMKLSKFMKQVALVLSKNTVYLWGCFGHPVGQSIIDAKAAQYPTWYNENRIAYFESLIGQHYFGFDCVNYIKAILWGWSANESSYTGGAAYNTQGVPDTNANGFFNLCTNRTTDFRNIIPGAVLWMDGHVGIYRGNNEAVECTFRWDDGVQVTGVQNLGDRRTKSRKWTQWGLCPFIDYTSAVPDPVPEPPDDEPDETYYDQIEHPDVPETPKEYFYPEGFRPLGPVALYRCNISEFVDGLPPLKDENGNPIPDGAICEVAISTPPQYCDLYRMAFGTWWKYSSDDIETVFDGYPNSPFSFALYPVQAICFDAFTNQERLIAVREELYQKVIYAGRGYSIAGVWTDGIDGMVATLNGGAWVNAKTTKSNGWTVSNIFRSNRNIWKDKARTTVLFAKNS